MQSSGLVIILKLSQLGQVHRGVVGPRFSVIEDDLLTARVLFGHYTLANLVIVETRDADLQGLGQCLPVCDVFSLVMSRAPRML